MRTRRHAAPPSLSSVSPRLLPSSCPDRQVLCPFIDESFSLIHASTLSPSLSPSFAFSAALSLSRRGTQATEGAHARIHGRKRETQRANILPSHSGRSQPIRWQAGKLDHPSTNDGSRTMDHPFRRMEDGKSCFVPSTLDIPVLRRQQRKECRRELTAVAAVSVPHHPLSSSLTTTRAAAAVAPKLPSPLRPPSILRSSSRVLTDARFSGKECFCFW